MPNEQAGEVTEFFDAKLGPDQAFEIDCPNILSHTKTTSGKFLKGFAVIESPIELDVLAVYTAGERTVETLHMERVPARRMAHCENFRLDLSTNDGGVPWKVKKDEDLKTKEPRPAVRFGPNNDWQWVSGWIDGKSTLTPTPKKTYTTTYEYCFCLCTDFRQAELNLAFMVDDSAIVYLNGGRIGGVPLLNQQTGVGTTNQSAFHAGENCVTVEVNDTKPVLTGFAVKGWMTSLGGRCPSPAGP